MNMRLAFRNLFRNLRRTIAIVLTIALGAAALFTFQGFIKGVLSDYKQNVIHAHNGHGQICTANYRESVYEKPWEYWIEDSDTIMASLQKETSVAHIFPRVSFPALLKHGNVSIAAQGEGVDAIEEAKFFDALNVEEGAMLSYEANGILLGRGLAKALGVKPGDTVELLTRNVKGRAGKSQLIVTGIFYTGMVDFDGRMFRIQLSEAKRILKTDRVEHISLGLTGDEKWPELALKLKKEFPHLDIADFAEIDQVYYQNSVDWLNSQYHIVQVIILSIVLLGIFNSISTTILERKQEIGNLRANGESQWSVVRLVIMEGALMGFIGSAVGMAVSYFVFTYCLGEGLLMPPGPGSTRSFIAKFEFTSQMAILTASLSLVSALIASTFAGLRVARMPIAKALRAL